VVEIVRAVEFVHVCLDVHSDLVDQISVAGHVCQRR
jgi:hypothetical protein